MSEPKTIAPAPAVPARFGGETIEIPDRSPYFIERMKGLGLDPENVPTWTSYTEYKGINQRTNIGKVPYFYLKENGDIGISYPAPYGQWVTFEGNGKVKQFERWRLHPDNMVAHGRKYGQPYASGVRVWLSPAILEALDAGHEIPTIYFIEGEFKAMAGSLMGLPFIGLTGIHGFHEKGATTVHPMILDILTVLRPHNAVYMQDADATAAPFDKWATDNDVDLGERLQDFHMATVTFRTMFQHHVAAMWLVHPKASLMEVGVKGLDDLCQWRRDQTATTKQKPKKSTKKAIYTTDGIMEELLRLDTFDPSAQYFDVVNLSKASASDLKRHYLVTRDSSGCPQAFYLAHQKTIGDSEFTFNGGRFALDGKTEKLEMVRHEDANKYIRLGTDYYKLIYKPDYNMEPVLELVPWKSAIIKQDYVDERGLKRFFYWIKKYDCAVNIPDHTSSYKLVHDINGSLCYNLYYRITHEPKPGQWPTIEKYLKHVFRTAPERPDVNRYEMILDAIQSKYLNPTQKLPALSLVSKEHGTGKTTFIRLMRIIFQRNMIKLGNDDITDNFNSDYTSKGIICIDEGLIEKQSTMEKLKNWMTSDEINSSGKHKDRQRANFHGWIIINSNNEGNFLKIDKHDRRFWPIKVHKYEGEEIVDTEMDRRFEAETPAFLHFLAHRTPHYPCSTQLYFDTHLLHSDAKDKLIEGSKSWGEGEFEEWVREQFLEVYLWPELYFTTKEITLKVNEVKGAQFRVHAITQMLHDQYDLSAVNSTYYQPLSVAELRSQGETAMKLTSPTVRKQGRCYTLKAEAFLTKAEIDEMYEARKDYGLPAVVITGKTKKSEADEPLPGEEAPKPNNSMNDEPF